MGRAERDPGRTHCSPDKGMKTSAGSSQRRGWIHRLGIRGASCGQSKRENGESEMIQDFPFGLLGGSEEMRSP